MQFYIIPENNFNFHTFFASFANFFGNEPEIVRRDQRKRRSLPLSLHGPAVGGMSMEMSVKALLHAVLPQQAQQQKAALKKLLKFLLSLLQQVLTKSLY